MWWADRWSRAFRPGASASSGATSRARGRAPRARRKLRRNGRESIYDQALHQPKTTNGRRRLGARDNSPRAAQPRICSLGTEPVRHPCRRRIRSHAGVNGLNRSCSIGRRPIRTTRGLPPKRFTSWWDRRGTGVATSEPAQIPREPSRRFRSCSPTQGGRRKPGTRMRCNQLRQYFDHAVDLSGIDIEVG